MVWTRASKVASSSTCPQSHWTYVPSQDDQDPESELEIVMEDIEIDDIAGSGLNSGRPIREASSTTNDKDENLIYYQEHFRMDKAWHHYNLHYHGHRIIVERGAIMIDFDVWVLKVQMVLDA